MPGAEKFRTARLVARSWTADDLPFAQELWGTPEVMALIDVRGGLSRDEVAEKLRTEIEREAVHGVQYWAIFERDGGAVVGCGGLRPWQFTKGVEGELELGFHLVKRAWGKGYATEIAGGALRLARDQLGRTRAYAGHHPENHASRKVLERLGFRFLEFVFYPPTGLMHPAYVADRLEQL